MCNIKVVKNLVYGCSKHVNHLLLKKSAERMTMDIWGYQQWITRLKCKASSGQIKLWKQSKEVQGAGRLQLQKGCHVPRACPRAATSAEVSQSLGVSLSSVQHCLNTVHQWMTTINSVTKGIREGLQAQRWKWEEHNYFKASKMETKKDF